MDKTPAKAREQYVIATRQHMDDAGHYRTRYFLHCVDGRPCFVEKRRAQRFDAEHAGLLVGQLRIVYPCQGFVVLDEARHPPRREWPHVYRAPRPRQAELET